MSLKVINVGGGRGPGSVRERTQWGKGGKGRRRIDKLGKDRRGNTYKGYEKDYRKSLLFNKNSSIPYKFKPLFRLKFNCPNFP